MPTLNIEGVGRVTVDDSFLKKDALEQQKIVDGIASEVQSKRAGGVAKEISGNELAYRSTILPLGKTKEGKIVPAVPGAIKSLMELPQQLIGAGQAGPPGSREVTEAAIAPAVETALALGPTSAASRGVATLLKKPKIQTTEELFAEGSAAYKTVEQSGAQIKPEAFAQMVIDLAGELKSEGFHPKLQTKATVPVEELAKAAASRKETGRPISFTELDTLRKMAQDAATSASKDDRRIGGIIKGHIDDFLSNLSSNEVIYGGDPKIVSSIQRKARELWARANKSNEIDQLFENAQLSSGNYNAAGFENALRIEFKNLAKSERRMRRFSPDEREAIKDVAKGSKLQDAFTKLGKFSPTSGFFGALFGAGSAELAMHASSPELLALAGIGAVARYAATKLRGQTAEGARKIVAGGKEAAEYMKQKTLSRKETISQRRQLGIMGGTIGGLGQSSPLRITIPLDPNNL